MSAELYAVVAIAAIVITALLTIIFWMHKEHDRVLTLVITKAGEKEIAWNFERQQLLDRIQAGNYSEYKTQEIRLVKAQQGEKEPQKQLEAL